MTDRGFSLIEVLVSLAVFSIAAIGLAQLTSEAGRNANRVDKHVIAGIEADNRLALIMVRHESEQGQNGSVVQYGHELDWQEELKAGPVEGLLIAEVRVRDASTNELLAARQLLIRERP